MGMGKGSFQVWRPDKGLETRARAIWEVGPQMQRPGSRSEPEALVLGGHPLEGIQWGLT